MKKVFKNLWIVLRVVFFLLKHKGYFEIYVESDNKDKPPFIDMQDDGDFYFYTSIQQIFKDIYEFEEFNK